MAQYDDRGREIPDARPVAVPHNWQRPLSLHEQIKRFIRVEASLAAEQEGEETWEEADDFDVDEEPDPVSRYEIPEAAPEWPQGLKDADADAPVPPKSEKSTTEASGGS